MGEIEGQMMLAEVADMVERHEAKQYEDFVEKFKPKKTTDDCYTPENIMEAVQDWVAREYNVDKTGFVRPFWPGADYQKEEYPKGCTVVDNPPFSILGQIATWYCQRGIRFFLFGPALTICSARTVDVSYICTGASITYANGAEVPTSFITNLDTCRLRTAPDLYQTLEEINKANVRDGKAQLPKYIYPDEVMTAAIAQRWCKYGLEYRLEKDQCIRIGALDSQKEQGKSIFGSGFLLSERAALERAALERAAATRWPLSDRERAISSRLGRGNA
jgi:hypothetical protein